MLYHIHSCTDSIMVTLIPLVILIVCSLQIARGLKHSDRFRQEQTHQQQPNAWSEGHRESTSSTSSVVRRVKLTRGLLIVIVTFTLFMLPLVPVSIIQIVSHNFFPSSCVYLITLHICSYVAALGSQLNSTANFFVYIVYWGACLSSLKCTEVHQRLFYIPFIRVPISTRVLFDSQGQNF
nr:unnamed protein product [Spirometra erinaceieuropaei]